SFPKSGIHFSGSCSKMEREAAAHAREGRMKVVKVRKQRAGLAIMCALSIALCAGLGVTGIVAKAWSGGAGFGDDDDNREEEGPSYFGFVRDGGGATVPDAKVTVGVKGRGGVVTRTDALGTYKVPGFGKDIDPKDVEVACDKQGYKQLRVVRR